MGASLVPCIVEAGIVPEGTLPEGQDVIIFPPAANSKSPWGTDFTASQVTYVSLAEVLDASSAAPPPVVKEPKLTDILIYVFTSGTSGLPKVIECEENHYSVPWSEFLILSFPFSVGCNYHTLAVLVHGLGHSSLLPHLQR